MILCSIPHRFDCKDRKKSKPKRKNNRFQPIGLHQRVHRVFVCTTKQMRQIYYPIDDSAC